MQTSEISSAGIKAVIFDLDGVLSDTDRTRFDLLKILAKKRGLDLKEEDYKKSVGRRTEIFLKDLFGGVLNDEEIRKIYLERKEEYHKNPQSFISPQPHAFECCKRLSEEGFTLAIASGAQSKDIQLVLGELGVSPYFKVIVGSDMIMKMKPHPETYLKCVEKLGFAKEECIAVEDSPTGVAAAKSAGITCVAVLYTHTKEELHQADKIISSLKELTREFIKGLSI